MQRFSLNEICEEFISLRDKLSAVWLQVPFIICSNVANWVRQSPQGEKAKAILSEFQNYCHG